MEGCRQEVESLFHAEASNRHPTYSYPMFVTRLDKAACTGILLYLPLSSSKINIPRDQQSAELS